MGYAFLWLEAMASALLLVAAVFAFSSRLKKWPALWPILMALLLTVPAIAATVFAGYIFFENIHPQWLFPYTLSWTLLFIVGSWVLIRRGRRKASLTSTAATWSRLKLSGALLIALTLQWSTTTALDNAAKLEVTAIQARALDRVQTILPSSPPYDQNAAELYEQANEILKQRQNPEEDLDRILDNSTDPAFDSDSKPARKLLQKNKKTIDLIKEATEKPILYHPYVLDGDSIVFPRFVPFKDAAALFALEARSHARNGHMAAALENIVTIDRISEQLIQTPLLLNVLASGAIQNRSKSALEIILAENSNHSKIKISLPVKFHEHILQTYKDSMVFEESFVTFSWAKTIINDEPMELLDLELESFYDPEDNLKNRISSYLYRIFLLQADQAAAKLSWETIHDFIQKPYYESGKELNEWEYNIKDHVEFGFFTSGGASPVSNYFKRATQHQTQFLLGRMGLAAAAYHSHHRVYPKSLDALTPKYIKKIPIDLFSGETIKMKTVKGGLILYSVGPNLQDDQGAKFEDTYGSGPTKGDIAFYLGSAFKEYRLQPALEKMNNKEEE